MTKKPAGFRELTEEEIHRFSYHGPSQMRMPPIGILLELLEASTHFVSLSKPKDIEALTAWWIDPAQHENRKAFIEARLHDIDFMAAYATWNLKSFN